MHAWAYMMGTWSFEVSKVHLLPQEFAVAVLVEKISAEAESGSLTVSDSFAYEFI